MHQVIIREVSQLKVVRTSRSGCGGRHCSACAGWKGHSSSHVTLNILVCYTLDVTNTLLVWLHWKNNHVYTITQLTNQPTNQSIHHQHSLQTTFKCADCISIINACMLTYCRDINVSFYVQITHSSYLMTCAPHPSLLWADKADPCVGSLCLPGQWPSQESGRQFIKHKSLQLNPSKIWLFLSESC